MNRLFSQNGMLFILDIDMKQIAVTTIEVVSPVQMKVITKFFGNWDNICIEIKRLIEDDLI